MMTLIFSFGRLSTGERACYKKSTFYSILRHHLIISETYDAMTYFSVRPCEITARLYTFLTRILYKVRNYVITIGNNYCMTLNAIKTKNLQHLGIL